MNQPNTHQVRRGETLSSIATLEAVDIKELATLNGIIDINKIRRGQVLNLPPEKIRSPADAGNNPPHKPPNPSQPQANKNRTILDDWTFESVNLVPDWLDELLAKLRSTESDERIQKKHDIPVEKPKQGDYKQTPPESRGSITPQTLSQVKQSIKARLEKEPHVLVFNGVKLTENEKKQIIAAVALCEMNKQGFASMNTDQEFVGRKYGNRGIETSYSRVVHIGLSYGVIQYTQDSGSLGALLSKMRAKNPTRFTEIFGDGDQATADLLVTLTTTGHPDLSTDAEIPLSGQAYWNKIRKTPAGKDTTELANMPGKSALPVNKEIRGKRVRPIPPAPGAAAMDIWTGKWKDRFILAGQCLEFQEVQLELAISNYFNYILPRAKDNKVRSALSLAFIAACAVRGGAESELSKLFYKIAVATNISLPFKTSDDERRCLDKIADTPIPKGQHITSVAGVTMNVDEIRRARLLRNDELGFLHEDLYDISTYS